MSKKECPGEVGYAPRENAIRSRCGDCQVSNPVSRTAFRKRVIPATAVQRCWHNHPRFASVSCPVPMHFALPSIAVSQTFNVVHMRDD